MDRRDRKGRTALMAAVQRGQVECVEALLMWGSSVWVEDEEGRNALAMANERGAHEVKEVIEGLLNDTEPPSLEADAWEHR